MPPIPDTRVSLVLRLPGGHDTDAWREFAATYEPFVYRFARRQGLQDADALELVQAVFLGVSQSIRHWQPDPSRAKFRTWLFRIAKNQCINLLQAKCHALILDSSGLDRAEFDDARAEHLHELDYQREVFRWAAAKVKTEVQPRTWTAFWETSVAGRTVDDVARQLGVRRSVVYVARSRVIARLRSEVQLFESEDER